ncbi:MAG: ABC transporter permease [Dehalococcoidia bacterium]|nr:ABC transporter permease [Dehalococcoidia bacterium]
MQGYILRRILATIPVMLIVAVLVFVLLQIAPGDPADLLSNENTPEDQVQKIRERMGLDRPIPVQLFFWLRNLLQGDLGNSVFSNKPVTGLLAQRAIPTVSLAVLIEIVAIGLGVPLGTIAAWKQGSLFDRAIMVFASLSFAVPGFFLGFIVIWVFALKFPILPAGGYVPPSEDLFTFFKHLILPSVAAGLIVMALITRMTRSSVLEVLREDYVRTARAKGLSENTVLIRHSLKNAALPIITVIGLGLAGLLSGVVVIEQVFAIPGFGRLMVDGIVKRDYPIIQGAILVTAAIFVLVNLLIDASYALFDPKIRY